VGTVIGAGFASGREIALFFGDMSPLAVAASGLFLGFFCALFLILGRRGFSWNSDFISFLVFLCSLITCAAMIAAAEDILFSMMGLKMLGFYSAVAAVVIAVSGIEKMKILNAVAVPLIIVFVVLVFVKNRGVQIDGSFGVLRPAAYSALNIFLAGILITPEGKNAATGEIALSSAFSGVFLSALLFMIQCIIRGNSASMPLVDAAVKLHLDLFAYLLVFLAVFTTLVSSVRLMYVLCGEFIQKNKFLSKNAAFSGRAVPALFTLTASYALSLLSFEKVVDWLYPLISACGVISVVIALYRLAKSAAPENRLILKSSAQKLKR
jgi:uncharacterized membrane protein YkvI